MTVDDLDMQIKIAIVDDDEGIRTGLAALIRRSPNFKLFVGDYANAETALRENPTPASRMSCSWTSICPA